MKLQLVSKELNPLSKVPLQLTGQELQAESYAVAKMNGIIHDMEIEIARGDTMINPKFRDARRQGSHLRHRGRQSDVEPALQPGHLCQRSI